MNPLQRFYDQSTSDRRQLLRSTGTLALGGLAGGALATSASAAPFSPVLRSPAPRSPVLPASPSAVLQGMCPFTPTATDGPFYLDLDQIKQDITDGQPGLPVTLIMQVLRASDCVPLPNVAVDVWQCDAVGVYSGFGQGQGQTFLRGTQLTDAGGLVIFQTIYPGWYPGRTCHYHVKVHPTSRTEFTTQLYYPQPLSDFVYANLTPYTSHGPATTKNQNDGLFTPTTVQAWIPDPLGALALWSGLVLGVS